MESEVRMLLVLSPPVSLLLRTHSWWQIIGLSKGRCFRSIFEQKREPALLHHDMLWSSQDLVEVLRCYNGCRGAASSKPLSNQCFMK